MAMTDRAIKQDHLPRFATGMNLFGMVQSIVRRNRGRQETRRAIVAAKCIDHEDEPHQRPTILSGRHILMEALRDCAGTDAARMERSI